ncbi:MAG: recombinase family protein, partial [Lachnospiraceae bacterium]|nr:recombinase family protein [Lachnospiraceae bacterium]
MAIYGIVRISTQKQNMLRQIRNIKAAYPTAIIIKEVYTGTKLKGRKDFEQVINRAKSDDIFVFDSVSRMCRNADEGCELYEQLFYRGINL